MSSNFASATRRSAWLVCALVLTFGYGCSGKKEAAAPAPAAKAEAQPASQAEPPALNAQAAQTVADALASWGPESCKSAQDPALRWLCSLPSMHSSVLAFNTERDAVASRGAQQRAAASKVQGDLSDTLAFCLQQATGKAHCVGLAFVHAAQGLGVPGADHAAASKEPAPPASEAPRFGAWQPDDYKSMTVEAYRAQHVDKLAAAKAHWDKRLQELRVEAPCGTPPSTEELHWNRLTPLNSDEAKRCELAPYRALFQRGETFVRMEHITVPVTAIERGCVEVAKWLVEHCVYPEKSRYYNSLNWASMHIHMKPENAEAWNARHKVYDKYLDAMAVYRANSPSWSSGDFGPVNHAAQTGEPDAIRFILATGANIETQRTRQLPLATAIVNYENACERTDAIANERCAGSFEVIKTLVMLGAPLDAVDYIYGRPLKHAIEKRLQPVIDFLAWAGAESPQPVAKPKPVHPAVARCIEQVNATLRTTTGGNIAGLQMQVRRQAQALQECEALSDGQTVAEDGALAGVMTQQALQDYAVKVGTNPRPFCADISERMLQLMRLGGWRTTKMSDELASVKKYGCDR
jgi:hypothetical protein